MYSIKIKCGIMKIKHLIIVSFLLILTIGAVSASENMTDDLTSDEEIVDEIATPPDDDSVSRENDESLATDDFSVTQVTNEVHLEDDNNDKTIFTVHCPEGSDGKVSIKYDKDYGDEDLIYIDIPNSNGDINVTYRTLSKFIKSMGIYEFEVGHYYNDEDIGWTTDVIDTLDLTVLKNLTKSDFSFDYNTYCEENMGDFIFWLNKYPCDGELLIYVDGEKKYSNPLYYDDEESVDVSDYELGFNEYRSYDIVAAFKAFTGEEVKISSFKLTYAKEEDFDDGWDDYYEPPAKKKVKLTFKKVNIKKSAKKLVLKATVKLNNKYKKGLKVVFKFNGKKYTAKTDKKGVAKLTVQKKVLKKLKKGKKVKVQASYGGKTVKYSIKVKK